MGVPAKLFEIKSFDLRMRLPCKSCKDHAHPPYVGAKIQRVENAYKHGNYHAHAEIKGFNQVPLVPP